MRSNVTTVVGTELDGTFRVAVRAPEAPYWSLSFDPAGLSFTPSVAAQFSADGKTWRNASGYAIAEADGA